MARVLYISYTGMLEPLGQSQVLSYLLGLGKNHQIALISFEKTALMADEANFDMMKERLAEAGVDWYPLRYHKKPPVLSTLYDIWRTRSKAIFLHKKNKFDIVHCRSYMPALIGLSLKKKYSLSFLFDMRGFWVDERVIAGIWQQDSILYRLAKRYERLFFLQSDHIVSLTRAGVSEIRKLYPELNKEKFSVIPTCVNLELFRPKRRHKHSNNLVVGIVGSVGTWSMLDEMLDCFIAIKEICPGAGLQILNRNEHSYIKTKILEKGVNPDDVKIDSVQHSEVSDAISRMDIGLFFQKAAFARQGSAPTKMAEFLACGVPCLSNQGAGDYSAILAETVTGVCVSSFSKQDYSQAFEQMEAMRKDDSLPARCVETATRYFSLESGINDYQEAYRRLL